MNEIEIKLTYEDEIEIEKILTKTGMIIDEIFDLEDRYYSQKGKGMENTNELVRIRKKGNHIELTYKGKCKDNNNIWTRKEVNVGIDNLEAMHNILLLSGFKMIKENISKRKCWRKGDTKLIFIKYSKPFILKMIEIESSNKEKIQKVMNDLRGLVKEAGEELFNVFDKEGKL